MLVFQGKGKSLVRKRSENHSQYFWITSFISCRDGNDEEYFDGRAIRTWKWNGEKKMEWCVKGGERETGNVFSVS